MNNCNRRYIGHFFARRMPLLLSWVGLGLLLFADPAQANSGLPYPMFMLGLSFHVTISTLGLGLLAIIALEAWGLWPAYGNITWWQIDEPSDRFACAFGTTSQYRVPHTATDIPNITEFSE